MIHDTRIIPTDGRPHPGPAIEQYLGDAKGRWDGDELVVETTNFTNRTAIGLNGNGNRTSTKLKLTERFKRVAKDIVQYQVTVDDPVTYERPWTMSMPLTPLDGGRILPYRATRGTWRSRSRSAANAPRIAPSRKIARRGSSGRGVLCRTALASAAPRSVPEGSAPDAARPRPRRPRLRRAGRLDPRTHGSDCVALA